MRAPEPPPVGPGRTAQKRQPVHFSSLDVAQKAYRVYQRHGGLYSFARWLDNNGHTYPKGN